jgi:hypothetical protein
MKKYILFLYVINCCACYNIDNNNTQLSKFERTIISSETLKPLQGLKVYLTDSGIIMDSTDTDKNGHYAFDVFSISENREYGEIVKTELYESDPGLGIDKIWYFVPVSWLRIHVKNTTPFDENDQIELEAFPSVSAQFKGKEIDETVIKKLRYSYGYTNYMNYFIKKNGKRTYTKIDIKPINFDTLDININY